MSYEEFKRKALEHAERLKWNPPFCEKCKIPMMLIQEEGGWSYMMKLFSLNARVVVKGEQLQLNGDGVINIKFTNLLKPKQRVGVDE